MLRPPQSRAWHVTGLRRTWDESVTTRISGVSWRYFRAVGRPLRHLEAGAYYHIGIRGNNHAPIVVDDGDRIVFFHILRRVERRYGWRTHVRCLMGNHYHLLVETPLPNLADGMRDLNGGYARAFNERHKRKDHVFGRRYWSKVIESDEQYEATLEYIVNNPLHHGFVRRLEQWRWTS